MGRLYVAGKDNLGLPGGARGETTVWNPRIYQSRDSPQYPGPFRSQTRCHRDRQHTDSHSATERPPLPLPGTGRTSDGATEGDSFSITQDTRAVALLIWWHRNPDGLAHRTSRGQTTWKAHLCFPSATPSAGPEPRPTKMETSTDQQERESRRGSCGKEGQDRRSRIKVREGAAPWVPKGYTENPLSGKEKGELVGATPDSLVPSGL